jgi:hypothetical protein
MKINQEESSKLHKLIELIEENRVSIVDERPELERMAGAGFVWVKSVSKLGDEFFTQLFDGRETKAFEIDVNYLSREFIAQNHL